MRRRRGGRSLGRGGRVGRGGRGGRDKCKCNGEIRIPLVIPLDRQTNRQTVNQHRHRRTPCICFGVCGVRGPGIAALRSTSYDGTCRVVYTKPLSSVCLSPASHNHLISDLCIFQGAPTVGAHRRVVRRATHPTISAATATPMPTAAALCGGSRRAHPISRRAGRLLAAETLSHLPGGRGEGRAGGRGGGGSCATMPPPCT